MDKTGINWNIKKFVAYHKAGMEGCQQAELQAIRAKIIKKNRDAKVIELMTKINLDTPMIVFKEDIRADRVLH